MKIAAGTSRGGFIPAGVALGVGWRGVERSAEGGAGRDRGLQRGPQYRRALDFEPHHGLWARTLAARSPVTYPARSYASASVSGGTESIPRSSSTDWNPLRVIHADSPSSSTVACSGPWRSSAEAVITTSAPASRYFATSAWSSTPVVAASAARTLPRSSAIHVRGNPASTGLESATEEGTAASVSRSISGCRKRLNRTSASAPASSSRSAISPAELKYGPSLTATGTVTAPLTR